MKSFHATLNLTFEAVDEIEALSIAKACKAAITTPFSRQPYQVEVDIDDVEEN